MRVAASTVAIFSCLARCVASPPAGAQADAVPKSTSDVDPGAVRYFNPGGEPLGRIEQTLPFDVPFYLRVPVNTDVRQMGGRYVGDTDPLICGEAFRRWRLNVKYADYGAREAAVSEQRREYPIGFTRFVNVAEPADLAGRYAELNVVRGLLPGRYYCFELTKVRDPVGDPAAFRKELAAAIDRLLRSDDGSLADDALEEATYRQLRRDVISALHKQLEPGERLIIPPGSFLDEEADDEAVPAESRRVFDEVLEAQKNRSKNLGNVESAASDARAQLKAVLESPALRVIRQTSQLDPMPADLQPVFHGKEDSLQVVTNLARQNDATLLAVATGTEAPGLGADDATKPLSESWTAEDLAPRRANLAALGTVLGDLQSVAFILSRDSGLQQSLVNGGNDLGTDLTELSRALSTAQALIEEDLSETLDTVSNAVAKRDRTLMALAEPLASVIIETILAEGTTTANYEVRANWYLGMDLGVAWAEGIEDFFTYVGTNVYFRPVNKKAPLRWSDFRRGQRGTELMKRLSVTIGLVINDLARNCRFGDPNDSSDCRLFQGVSQENITQGLVGDKPLVVAGGLRLSDFFRISAGALVFKESESDPLLGGSRLAWSPMVSISIDWNLRGILRNRLTQEPYPTRETTE